MTDLAPLRPMTAPEPGMKGRLLLDKTFAVQVNGPAEIKGPYRGSGGWNSGDIDFREDGSIFIRNPYLANAIEEQIQRNLEKVQENPGNKDLFVFRLTRDRGWSGGQQNIVC